MMNKPTLGITFASLGALGFSFKAVFIKAAYVYGVDAETLLALRMGYSLPFFIVMGVVAARSQPMTLARKDWGMLALLGVLGYYLASYLDFLGLQYISAALERLILFLYPTFVLLLSAVFLKKPITRSAIMPLALCYGGITIAVVGDGRSASGGGQGALLGSALVVASSLAYAIYLMLSGQIVRRLGSLRVTAYATMVACALSLIQFVLIRPLSSLAQPWQVHALSVCMAIFSTVLPIWLVAEAIRRLGAGPASMVGSLGPVFTIILAAVILGEHIGPWQIAGAALVIVGVSRVSRMKA
ncbi:DMT family transporter [Uliginosibacterium sp. sgz301328]|uniref:DMT family transporter n=1 Tax=Uliginosibacterium sp. sgz301328 TaxID=3243764 RepID=UPI00359D3216